MSGSNYLLLLIPQLFASCVNYYEAGLASTEQSEMRSCKEKPCKHGVWKNYLNENFKSCPPAEGKYYEYVMFNHGAWLSSSFGTNFEGSVLGLLVVKRWEIQPNSETMDSFPHALNGTYAGYAQRNIKLIELVYRDGMLEHITAYYRNGDIRYTEDYVNDANPEPFGGERVYYRKNGGVFSKGTFEETPDGGWNWYRVLND